MLMSMRLTMNCVAGLLVAVAVCCAAACADEPPVNEASPLGSAGYRPSPAHPIGWRGDGNGRYPAAQPPLDWGRQSRAVRELRFQARKPRDGDVGKPMPDGVVRDWLVLGPVPIPAGASAKGDISGEADLIPDEGDKSGELAWKPVAIETPSLNFRPMYDNAAKDANSFVAYAHAWINSAEGRPVYVNLMLSDVGKVWLNGKELAKLSANGTHVLLPLKRGWNGLLVRVAPLAETGWSKGVVQWHLGAAFFGTERDTYESRNIAWAMPLPDNGPGAGSPIVVGDRIYLQAERSLLVCVRADDGKVLWARSTTYADAALAEEKTANAAVSADIAALQAKVADSLAAYCADPAKYASDPKLRAERLAAEKKINDLMIKIDRERYAGQSDSEGGEGAATPVSDGEHVYALFGSGVAACFDMQGNRKWAAAVGLKHNEHGYCASPCLVNGKLIVKSMQYLGAVALDARTGAVVTPMTLWKSKGLHSMSSPIAIAVGGEKLAVQSFGVVVRVRDGAILARDFTPPYYNIADYASPVTEGRTICSFVLTGDEGGIRFAFQTLPETLSEPLKMAHTTTCQFSTKPFPTWFSYNQCGSPLLYQGLAYLVSSDGILTVMDSANGRLVYQKQLDVNPYMIHNGIVRGGCAISPTLGGRHIYLGDNQGTMLVIEPGREFRQVARNRLEQLWFRYGFERNECMVSCPVFVGARMYLRGEANLYCIGRAEVDLRAR